VQQVKQKLSQAEVIQLFSEISNWDKWGRDDERGTLNYITPRKVVEAGCLVKTGRVVSIAHDVVTQLSPVPRADGSPAVQPAKLTIFGPTPPHFSASDEFSIRPHGYAPTHLDALTHCSFDGHFWNGKSLHEAVTDTGVQFGSIYAQRDGIVTRGVLLDVARARGVPHLEREDTVTIEDLDAAEKLSGTRVSSGDAVLVRAGMGLRISTPADIATRTGLGPECARWLHAREVAVFGSDCPEKVPSGYDDKLRIAFHQLVLVQMGLILLDNAAMEPLAAACAEEGTNEFMFVVGPLPIPKASSSVVNPLAIF
jgi:kynurenine formamidase